MSGAELIERVNQETRGRSCDDLEFVPCRIDAAAADVHFTEAGLWVARVPLTGVSAEILQALSAAVRIGRALGRQEGKREIGDFLRQECGL